LPKTIKTRDRLWCLQKTWSDIEEVKDILNLACQFFAVLCVDLKVYFVS